MNNHVYILNIVFLKNRISELGIKQWWLAEQIGVDRKTISRWIQGKVKNIHSENALALIKILDCELKDIILINEADQLASIEDQKNAATLIAKSSLVNKLGAIGEWNVIESLLKATIVPNLPLNILGELYNQLAVASWRQSKIDQADIFNQKAEEIARRSMDKSILAEALLTKSNIYFWRGKSAQAIQTYNECLELKLYIGPKIIGSIYSNLGAVYYESGDLEKGIFFEKKAVEIFVFHGSPLNLSIAWCHLAIIYLEKNDLDLAVDAGDRSLLFAKEDDYRRGLAMGDLIRSEIFARKGYQEQSKSALQAGLAAFGILGIEEGLNYEFAGRISRMLGNYSASREYLAKGIAISTSFPLYQAALHREMSITLKENRDNLNEFEKHKMQAIALYLACEAPIRAKMMEQIMA